MLKRVLEPSTLGKVDVDSKNLELKLGYVPTLCKTLNILQSLIYQFIEYYSQITAMRLLTD